MDNERTTLCHRRLNKRFHSKFSEDYLDQHTLEGRSAQRPKCDKKYQDEDIIPNVNNVITHPINI